MPFSDLVSYSVEQFVRLVRPLNILAFLAVCMNRCRETV